MNELHTKVSGPWYSDWIGHDAFKLDIQFASLQMRTIMPPAGEDDLLGMRTIAPVPQAAPTRP